MSVFVDLWIKTQQLQAQSEMVRERENQWRVLTEAVDEATARGAAVYSMAMSKPFNRTFDLAAGTLLDGAGQVLAGDPHVTDTLLMTSRDGRAFPIVGTTYMASDVHRDFLFEPNVDAWNADFADMKRRGINFVRKFTLKLRQEGDRWLLTRCGWRRSRPISTGSACSG